MDGEWEAFEWKRNASLNDRECTNHESLYVVNAITEISLRTLFALFLWWKCGKYIENSFKIIQTKLKKEGKCKILRFTEN